MDNDQPIQNDTNQASGTPSSPDVNNAAPQANALPTNTRPTNMPVPSPQAPAKPQTQPTQPTNPNQTAALTPTQAQPSPVHKSLFDRIFTGLGGGPRYVTKPDPNDPTKAVTTEVPTSRGDITKSLLAGVIHGIIAGGTAAANAPADKYTDADGRVHEAPSRVNSNMAALGAGYQAGKQNQQQFKNAPQQAYDQDMVRKAAIVKNTTDELRNQMMSDKLHMDDWQSKEDYYNKTQDIYKPIIDNITQASKDSGVQLVAFSGLSHDEAYKQLEGHIGQYSPIQDGWTTETHSDGRTYHLPSFSLVKSGTVDVDRNTLLALTPYNQGIKDLLDKNSSSAIPLSTSMLIGFEKSAVAAHGAYEFLHQMQGELGVKDDDQMSQAAFNEKYRGNPALQRQVNDIASTLGGIGTQSTAHALAQLQQSGKAGEFFKLLGKNPDEVQDYINDKKNDELQATAEATADLKRKDADRPAAPARIQNAPVLIRSSSPYLNKAQVDSYISKLHPTMSNDELDKVQKEASDENDRVFTQRTKLQELEQNKTAKDDTAIAKGEKPVVGVDASGNQVLVPAGDVKKYGLAQVREVGQAENEKVTNARSLLTVFNNNDPDDLGIMQLAQKLDKEGKLGPAASRFQDWLNKSGSVVTNLAGFDAGDPDVQRLFTKLGLSTTGLMQVHVGARGSAQMLEHFEDLAKANSMSPQAFRAAIDTENSYVRMKAMMPNSGKGAQAQTPTAPAGSDPFAQFGGKTRGQ